MKVKTYTYTLHHVFILKMLLTYTFDEPRTLHNFLFLAKACAGSLRSRFLYGFHKSRLGPYSFEIDGHLRDLRKNKLLEEEMLLPTKEGREFYYQVASLLKYELFPEHCYKMATHYQGQLWRVNHEVLFHPLFRKARQGRKINV